MQFQKIFFFLSLIQCRSSSTGPTRPFDFSGFPSDPKRPKTAESNESIPEPVTAASTTLSRVVETKYGKVQGLSVTLFSNQKNRDHPLKNKIVEIFLSLPYASPPVKSHRFSPTQTPLPWDGVRSAVKPGFVCPQVLPEIRDEARALNEMPRGYLEYLRRVEPYLRNQSEDCLYLNIFAPVGGSPPPEQKKPLHLRPVLVFIHGGKFSWGSGNLYDGTLLAAASDVVVVTINYRLGVLGFLNVNPSPMTKPRVANYGLMDQIAALHWLKENILAFGGDPESMTLMGYDSGAASIHFLMSSPAVMEGLFHRAILIAGSAHAPWAIIEDPSAVANALADSLNCSLPPAGASFNSTLPSGQGTPLPKYSPESIFDCLRNKHFSYFSKFHPPKFSVDFGPSVDGIVIRPDFKQGGDLQAQMAKRDISHKYDLLFGISSVEMLTAFSEADLVNGFESARRDAVLRTLVRNSYRFHLNEILSTITNEYIDWERSPQHPIATRDLTIQAVTDALSLAPVISSSDSPRLNKSYFYVFDHSTKDGLYNYQQKLGPGGGDELNYFFGYPLLEHSSHGVPFFPTGLPASYTKAEVALCELMITHLSNFIHSGDTNEPIKPDVTWPISKERNKYRNVQWEPYDRLHQKYLELSTSRVRARSHFRAHQMAIWLRLVPELQRSGAQYATVYHNRIRGGYNPSLYVGSLHLPQELEAALDPTSFDLDFDYNGTGIPPSPPTTCYSPLSSLASEAASRGGIVTVEAALAPSLGQNRSEAEAGLGSTFSPYTTALSVTIAIGCSFLILNVFIFALVYYQRDKKRVEEMIRRKGRRRGNSSTSADEETGTRNDPITQDEDELKNYTEPTPELLKHNTTTATSFHQEGNEITTNPCFYTDVNDLIPTHGQRPHKEVHFSPKPLLSSGQRLQTQGQEILGISTLPRGQANHVGQDQVNHVTQPDATLSKKPTPPTRNFTNYNISRQIFSLIVSLMTFGIL